LTSSVDRHHRITTRHRAQGHQAAPPPRIRPPDRAARTGTTLTTLRIVPYGGLHPMIYARPSHVCRSGPDPAKTVARTTEIIVKCKYFQIFTGIPQKPFRIDSCSGQHLPFVSNLTGRAPPAPFRGLGRKSGGVAGSGRPVPDRPDRPDCCAGRPSGPERPADLPIVTVQPCTSAP
jgi:hypothetical protein